MLMLVVMNLTTKGNSEVFTTDKEIKQSTVYVFPPAKIAKLSAPYRVQECWPRKGGREYGGM